MKKLLLLLMMCAHGELFAQSMPLPPVVDYSTYPEGSSYTPKPSPAKTLYEVFGRLEQLQNEVQQLRGIIEEQEYTITELKKRQNTIYSDLDQRITALEGGGAIEVPETAEQPQPAESQEPVVLPPSAPAAVPPAASISYAESEKERYNEAYETLKNGHYTQAITELNRFLSDFPGGEYADNAQYWLGEAYKVNQDIDAARAAFNKVVTDHPKSPKVRDALLKLGYIEFDQNNPAKAREYFTRITVGYPGSTAAHLANKKLQQMNNQP
ncbi:MAG: tol-pal system protein YbgF [Gammaproteobacteria bacterium]